VVQPQRVLADPGCQDVHFAMNPKKLRETWQAYREYKQQV
jgi:hypothetical protein